MAFSLLIFLFAGFTCHALPDLPPLPTNLGDPTQDELNKYLVVKPNPAWGSLAREQGCVKVIAVGGSNSMFNPGFYGYAGFLDNFLKTMDYVPEYFRDHSYSHSRGLSGQPVASFIGKKLPYENDPPSTWPNVVLMETAVNMDNQPEDKAIRWFEDFIRSFNWKYEQRNMTTPDYLFYNMPYFAHIKVQFEKTRDSKDSFEKIVEQRKEFLKTFDGKRGHSHRHIEKYAQYYGIPVIGWGEAMEGAIMRYYLQKNSSDWKWLYSSDGKHLTTEGNQIGNDRMLNRFFQDVFIKKDKNSFTKRVEVPRLVPPGPVLFEVDTFTSVYIHPAYSLHSLAEAIVTHSNHTNSGHTSGHTTGDYRTGHSINKKFAVIRGITHVEFCFGSTVKGAEGTLKFHAPSVCRPSNPCTVSVQLFHSWNASFIGDTDCSLRHKHSNLSTIHIGGQKDVGSFTFPISHVFPVNVTESGGYHVRCENLAEDRLTCVTGLEISTTMVV